MDDDDYIIDPTIADDECHLYECVHPSRKITVFIAIVRFKNIEVAMHTDCAQIFKEATERIDQIDLCRVNARWN